MLGTSIKNTSPLVLTLLLVPWAAYGQDPTASPEPASSAPVAESTTTEPAVGQTTAQPQPSNAPSAEEPRAQTSEPQPDQRPLLRPLVLSTDDGRFSLRFSFAGQLQLDVNFSDLESDDSSTDALFRLRRVQAFIAGHLFTPALKYKFMIETVPGRFDIMDLFLDYRFHQQARLRFGIAKVGFMRMRLNAWKNQQFVDFSDTLRYWGTERQLGFTLHNGLGRNPGHEYEVGVYAGQPTRPGISYGLARLSGEPRPHPMLVSGDVEPITEFHPEIVAHYAYNGNDIDVTVETDWARTGFRYSLGVGFSYDFRPSAYRDFAMRIAAEMMFKAYGWNLIGVFWTGFYDKRDDLGDPNITTDFNLGILGMELQTGYHYADWGEVALRYAFLRTSENFRDDTRARSTQLIDAAEDEAERTELQRRYGNAGTRVATHELALGLNFYPFGRNLKLASDLSLLMNQTEGQATTRDLRLRFLVQLHF